MLSRGTKKERNMQRRIRLILAAGLALLLFVSCTPQTSAPTSENIADRYVSSMKRAASCLQNSDTDGAIAAYQEALTLEPGATDAVRGLLSGYQTAADAGTDVQALQIETYETLFAMDAFTEEDYLSLAALYQAAGKNVACRDLLERGQCLAPSAEKQALLEALLCDAATDTAVVQAQFQALAAALSAGQTDEAVQLLLAANWREAVRPRNIGMQRRYTYAENGASLLAAVTCDASGMLTTDLWYTGTDGRCAVLRLTNALVSAFTADSASAGYQGAFRSVCCTLSNRTIVVDSGTMVNGVCTGSLQTELYSGGKTELSALYAERETLTPATYTGALDGAGHTTEAQIDGAPGVIYGYQAEQPRNYVYILDPDNLGVAGFVFDAAALGVAPYPVW